jgi:hypothetical protein
VDASNVSSSLFEIEAIPLICFYYGTGDDDINLLFIKILNKPGINELSYYIFLELV